MKLLLPNIFRSITLALLVSVLLLGCGGGTTGTGSTGASDFRGRIALDNGTPLSGVEVTVSETGESAITDENGNFQFEATFTGAEVNLFLETSGLQGTLNLGEIPDNSIVEVDIVVGIQGNTITITLNSLTVTPRS